MASNSKKQPTSDLILGSEVAQGIAIIGDRWAFLIMREIYLGVRRFEDLRRKTEAARGTLTARLKSMVKNGLLYKNPYQDNPVRYEYRLTDKGLDLYPMVLMTWNWEHNWGQRQYLPGELVHRKCGKSFLPQYRCTICKKEAVPREFEFAAGPNSDAAKKVPPRFQRRAKSKAEKDGRFGKDEVSVLDCIGDRWTSLVIAAAFFGLRRFDDIAAAIGIATNILADRLNLLVKTEVFDRVPYRERPTRHEYFLSDKGRGLYAQTIAMHEWADRWLIEPGKEPLIVTHTPCNRRFHGEVVCNACGDLLDPHDVDYKDY